MLLSGLPFTLLEETTPRSIEVRIQLSVNTSSCFQLPLPFRIQVGRPSTGAPCWLVQLLVSSRPSATGSAGASIAAAGWRRRQAARDVLAEGIVGI
jgi:hypothetical protein